MPTVRTTLDLITAALQTIGVYGAAETLSAEDAQLGLDTLQDMLAEWSDGGLMVPYSLTETIPLVIGQETYTIGEDGTPSLDTVRPEQVMGALVRDAGNYDYEVDIIGETQYRSLSTKTEVSGRPDRIWVEYTVPNVTIHAYPSPDAAESLVITSRKTFTEPTTYVEDLMLTTKLPRNYFNALRWNLALELCTPFLREPTTMVVKRAQETKGDIKKLNFARTMEPVAVDIMGSSTRGRYNILEG